MPISDESVSASGYRIFKPLIGTNKREEDLNLHSRL